MNGNVSDIEVIINSLGDVDANKVYLLYGKNGDWWKYYEEGKEELVEDWLRRTLRCEFKGSTLEFISRINSDGSVKEISDKDLSVYKDEYFTLYPLSFTKKTYIALGCNSFVVKKKK
jgi:hypothetical protein